MVERHTSSPKQFTPAEANKMLPLVAAIVEDWMELSGNVAERQSRLQHLTDGRELDNDDPYSGELVQVRRELAAGHRQIGEFAKELRQLGVVPGDPKVGTVDFPACLDGDDGAICWKFGEPEVLYWHSVGQSCADRQRLTAGLAAGNSDIEGTHP